jgi:hypothetical protein
MSLYNGQDMLNALSKEKSTWVGLRSRMGNSIASFRWNHAFSNGSYSNMTFFTSNYRFRVLGEFGENSMETGSEITDIGVRTHIDQTLNKHFGMTGGLEMIHHTLVTESSIIKGQFNENFSSDERQIKSLPEGALFVSANIQLSRSISTEAGFRYSFAATNKTTYAFPEPRIQIHIGELDKGQLSFSYAAMTQYMFQLSGSSATIPSEQWYCVSEKIKPQQAQLFTTGFEKSSDNYSFKTEGFYKPMKNLVEYREGTVSLGTNNPDQIMTQGSGLAYGVEVSGSMSAGNFTVTSAYTWSKSNRTFSELNDGNSFLARYDRRHDFNISLSAKCNERWSISMIWTYATGSRYTPVIGRFMMPNTNYTGIDLLPLYASRNSFQLNAAHKLDVNIIWRGKQGLKFYHEWHFGAYNLYNQTQPYRIRTDVKPDGSFTYKQVGLFGFIPSGTYQFKF